MVTGTLIELLGASKIKRFGRISIRNVNRLTGIRGVTHNIV